MVTSLENPQNGCLSTRRIRADECGQEIETRFIHKNKETVLQTGFFFISNQTFLRQRAISVSSRWVARSIGCWGVHFNSLSKRATCPLWYETPNSISITFPTLAHVHTSPRNPDASAPCERKSGINPFSTSVSSGGLPVWGRAYKPFWPCSLATVSHWLTALLPTFNPIAISFCFQPLCFSSNA